MFAIGVVTLSCLLTYLLCELHTKAANQIIRHLGTYVLCSRGIVKIVNANIFDIPS